MPSTGRRRLMAPMTSSSTSSEVRQEMTGEIATDTSINITEELPPGWYPVSRPRRMSVSNFELAQAFWERKYGIKRTEIRRFSEPPDFSPHRFGRVQPKKWYHTVLQSIPAWLGSLRRTEATNPRQIVAHSTLQATQTDIQQSVIDDTPQPTQVNANTAPQHIQTTMLAARGTSNNSTTCLGLIGHGVAGLVQACWMHGKFILEALWTLIGWLFWLLKWPVIAVFVLLALLNILALGYTLSSNAFLNVFCEMRFPILRNRVCVDWDRVKGQYTREAIDISQGFETIFQGENLENTFSMPYFLSEYRSQYRYLRAHLKTAKLTPSDEEFFYYRLTDSMELSREVEKSSWSVYRHLHGTVNHIADGARFVVGPLNASGFASRVSSSVAPKGSRLVTGVQWMNKNWMLFLLAGIEPFHERVNTQTAADLMRMRLFYHTTNKRLQIDMFRISGMRRQVKTLEQYADDLDQRAVKLVDQEATFKVKRGRRRFYGLLELIREQNLEDWITDQRLRALESMAPVYQGHLKYLDEVALRLDAASVACEMLEEYLSDEEIAVRQGIHPSPWVLEQPRLLERGATALAQELKVWDLKQKQFTARFSDGLRGG